VSLCMALLLETYFLELERGLAASTKKMLKN